MTTLVSKLSDIQAALEALVRQHKVPGASLGVMSDGDVLTFSTGIANKNTGLSVTDDTLFQIGSITKVYTATLVMKLVDEGKVDLDAPVVRYIPEFKLSDPRSASKITVRHLLTHTNGIDGADYFEDFGQGDDALERFVESLSQLGQIHAPGEMWSYCNTGYCLAGRIVEKLTGEPFRKAFHERLLEPLGLGNTSMRVEDMLVKSTAAGHITPPGADEPVVTPMALLPACHAAAGSLTVSTPKDVLAFVRLHLDAGRAADGSRYLKADTAKQLQQPQTKAPRSSIAEAFGIGWGISDWDGERVIGHGGGTVGQLAFLQVLVDRRFAVCLLTNSNAGGGVWRDLGRYLFEEFAGVKMPQPPKAPEEPPRLELRRFTGTYRRRDIDTEVSMKNGELMAKITYHGPLTGLAPPQEIPLRAIDNEMFQMGPEGVAEFIGFDSSGRPRYVHSGGRVSRRVESKARARTKKKTTSKKRKS